MAVKTSIKVRPKVKRFSPRKFILHELLRPGYSPDYDNVAVWCMIECKISRAEAEKVLFGTLEYIEENDIDWRDRDKLRLPNISTRYTNYPDIAKHWKSRIEEPS